MVCITNRSSFTVIIGNQVNQSGIGKFFLLWVLVDGNQTKVSFFENGAWTMTKALCLNPMAG